MSPIRLILVGFLLALPSCVSSERIVSVTEPPGLERAALDLVNASRRAHGLASMRLDPMLSEIALAHARDMKARGYYAHESPAGWDVQDRHDDAGGADWRLVAENIARCSACSGGATTDQVRDYHERWMNSPGHRDNILSQGLDSFGFAAVGGERPLFFVQTFSGPGEPHGLKPGDSLAALSPGEQAAVALSHINEARARAGAPPLTESSSLTAAVHAVFPRPGGRDFDVRSTGDVQRALPEGERARWQSIGTIYGACGACGRAPTAADIRFFVSEWLEKRAFRALLLNPEATHLGFGLTANGEGKKIALVAIGAE